ncbi:MAG: hypothetical protein IPH29_08490 [Candidatus Microthrix sp.]|nr:hypothetical protein [Candidatus Microthrix sp.]
MALRRRRSGSVEAVDAAVGELGGLDVVVARRHRRPAAWSAVIWVFEQINRVSVAAPTPPRRRIASHRNGCAVAVSSLSAAVSVR